VWQRPGDGGATGGGGCCCSFLNKKRNGQSDRHVGGEKGTKYEIYTVVTPGTFVD
jgi:hypothetical protein